MRRRKILAAQRARLTTTAILRRPSELDRDKKTRHDQIKKLSAANQRPILARWLFRVFRSAQDLNGMIGPVVLLCNRFINVGTLLVQPDSGIHGVAHVNLPNCVGRRVFSVHKSYAYKSMGYREQQRVGLSEQDTASWPVLIYIIWG